MCQAYMNAGDPTDAAKWTMVLVGSRAKARITNLVPGQYYSYRVTALGRIGEGPASAVVGCRAA